MLERFEEAQENPRESYRGREDIYCLKEKAGTILFDSTCDEKV